MRSPQPTSAIDPRDTTWLKPMPSRRLQSSTAVRSAPLWLTKPTDPRLAMSAANVALSPETGLMTPRQLGPTTRMPAARAVRSTSCSSAAPAGPTSRNPALMMMTPRMPRAAHSSMSAGTDGGGVTMTARSTGSPMAVSEGDALMPRMALRVGLTGKTVPPKGLLMRFHRMVRPTLPSRSVAPTTATPRGRKMASRG